MLHKDGSVILENKMTPCKFEKTTDDFYWEIKGSLQHLPPLPIKKT